MSLLTWSSVPTPPIVPGPDIPEPTVPTPAPEPPVPAPPVEPPPEPLPGPTARTVSSADAWVVRPLPTERTTP